MRLSLELCDSTITYRTRYLGSCSRPRCSTSSSWTTPIPRSGVPAAHHQGPSLDYLARASGVRVAALPTRWKRTLRPSSASSTATSRRGGTKGWRSPCCETSHRIPSSSSTNSPRRSHVLISRTFRRPRPSALGRRLSMHYLLSHRTTYTYASTVVSAHHIAHLRAAISRADRHRDQHRHQPGHRRSRRSMSIISAISSTFIASRSRTRASTSRCGPRSTCGFPIRRRPAPRRPGKTSGPRCSGTDSHPRRGQRVHPRVAAGAERRGVGAGLWRTVIHAGAPRFSRRRAS